MPHNLVWSGRPPEPHGVSVLPACDSPLVSLQCPSAARLLTSSPTWRSRSWPGQFIHSLRDLFALLEDVATLFIYPAF